MESAAFDAANDKILIIEVALDVRRQKSNIAARAAKGKEPVIASSRNIRNGIATQIEALRAEARLTIEDLAHKVEVDPRSVQRHLAGHSQPYKRHLRAYERVFSKLLNRSVVINEMS